MLIEVLRQVEVDGAMSLEKAIELSAIAKSLVESYESNDIPVPTWLSAQAGKLLTTISDHQREARMKRLREIEAEQTQLLTAREKRERLDAEKAQLEKKLGVAVARR